MKIFSVFFILVSVLCSQEWQSSIVYYDQNNKLVYKRDSGNNRIPEFSYAGYYNGEKPLPDIPVVKTISPVAGDNTSHIQKAIDSVSALPLNTSGFRGALLLTAGVYHVWGSIKINTSGVVLRGVGRGTDSTKNTIIYGRGDNPSQRTIIIVGSGSTGLWRDSISGTKTDIISDTVLIGERSFFIQDSSKLKVGDNIVIYHPCTEAWLEAINYGDGAGGPLWTVNELPIIYNRYITAKTGNRITVDVPVFNHLIRSLSQCFVYKYSGKNLKRHIGIENLFVDIESLGGTDENHAWNAIDFYETEDCWLKNCTMRGFGFAGIETNTTTRMTIDSCNSIDPVSIIEGGKRYNFCVYQGSQQILFKNCYARNGRHHFVSNGTSSVSGVVFVDCVSERAYASSEGHRRWSQGLLFDNIKEISPVVSTIVLGLYNRGNYGTSHGWASVHSVAWNYNLGGKTAIIQKPPTAQNYAIGCTGTVSGIKPPAPFDQPQGFIEGTNKSNLKPRSLYYAQLQERLSSTPLRETKIMNFDFRLEQNYPNPFNPSTSIIFTLPTGGKKVRLKIYDSLGNEIQRLVDGYLPAGQHKTEWYAAEYSSGVYYYELSYGEKIIVKKMVLVK